MRVGECKTLGVLGLNLDEIFEAGLEPAETDRAFMKRKVTVEIDMRTVKVTYRNVGFDCGWQTSERGGLLVPKRMQW